MILGHCCCAALIIAAALSKSLDLWLLTSRQMPASHRQPQQPNFDGFPCVLRTRCPSSATLTVPLIPPQVQGAHSQSRPGGDADPQGCDWLGYWTQTVTRRCWHSCSDACCCQDAGAGSSRCSVWVWQLSMHSGDRAAATPHVVGGCKDEPRSVDVQQHMCRQPAALNFPNA